MSNKEKIMVESKVSSRIGHKGVHDREIDPSSSTESTSSPAKSTKKSRFARRKGPRTAQTAQTNSSNVINSRKKLSLGKLSLRRRKYVKEGRHGDRDGTSDGDRVHAKSTPANLPGPSVSPSGSDANNESRRKGGRKTAPQQESATRRSFLQGLSLKTFSKERRDTEKDSCKDKVDSSSRNISQLAERTTIVAELGTSPARTHQPETEEEEREDFQERLPAFSCATAILEHHYLERICGPPVNRSLQNIHSDEYPDLPEDPTIQESIECIFAAQLEDGLNLWDEDEDRPEQNHVESRNPDEMVSQMVSPSLLQQSRQNRSDRLAHSVTQNKKRYEQASLVYVGTFDPTITHDELDVKENRDGPLQCQCERSQLPSLAPKDWPQAPILLRPTPDKGTKIKGVRIGDSKDYIWEPGSHLSWSQVLAQRWGNPCKSEPRVAHCEKCTVLPINNGNEAENEELSIDFESDLFVGSLLLRIRHTEGTTANPYDDGKGYFKGVNRRYQAVVQGRFKKRIPFTELITGFQFDRRCGRLPAKWILRGGIKVLSFFAPQLDCKMEGDRPHSLTPLGSTPQVVRVDNEDSTPSMTLRQVEPTEASQSLLGHASSNPSSMHRARARKKGFDKLFVQKSNEPRTDPGKIYTFEFLQHLFNFQEFSIELGSMLGSVDLKDLLDGQPLQIMASHGEHRLWSFDIWHENLWEDAEKYE